VTPERLRDEQRSTTGVWPLSSQRLWWADAGFIAHECQGRQHVTSPPWTTSWREIVNEAGETNWPVWLAKRRPTRPPTTFPLFATAGDIGVLRQAVQLCQSPLL
jgi:hypothetical protein